MRPYAPTVRGLAVVGALGLIALIGGLLRGLLIASLVEAGESDPPNLVMRQAILDFAEVSPGQNLKGYVRLRNAGGQRLIIHMAASDCPCCEDQSDAPVIIGPNADGRLPVELIAPRQPGMMTRHIAFESNDPTMSRFSVTAKASVIEALPKDGRVSEQHASAR